MEQEGQRSRIVDSRQWQGSAIAASHDLRGPVKDLLIFPPQLILGCTRINLE